MVGRLRKGIQNIKLSQNFSFFSAKSSNQKKFIADVSEVRGTLRITQLGCIDLFLFHPIDCILFVTENEILAFLCVRGRRVPRTSETSAEKFLSFFARRSN